MADDLNRVTSVEEHQRRVWAILAGMPARKERLDKALANLANARAELVRDRNRPLQKSAWSAPVSEQSREDRQRSQELDARIDQLVREIHEYIRRRDAEKP
jgi:hypothetical protein